MSKKFVIITGQFHEAEAKQMVAAATDVIEGQSHSVTEVVWVPGSYEVPLALKRQLMRDDVDGAVVLGIIERGETAHGLVMGQSVSNKILDIQIDHMKPVGLGILGPEIFPSQIADRVEPYAADAARAAIAMLD